MIETSLLIFLKRNDQSLYDKYLHHERLKASNK